MLLFCFFVVFMFAINKIYFANIIYSIIYVKQVIKKNSKLILVNNSISIWLCLLFLFYITLNTLIYTIHSGSFDSRNLFQYLFNLQYLLLILPIKINVNFFERWVYLFSILLAIIIIAIFITVDTPFAVFSRQIYR